MTVTAAATACIENADLFLDEMLENPTCVETSADRRRAQLLTNRATQACLACPIMAQCLTDAVIKHDVTGFCAGTTQRQRQQIRNLLGWRIKSDDLDTYTGLNSGHQIDHDELIRLHETNPNETLGAIADRLGCSVSTVKRHLRLERRGEITTRPKLAAVPPSTEQVLQAYRQIVNPEPSQLRRAA